MFVEDMLVVGADVNKFQLAAGGVNAVIMWALLIVAFFAAAGASMAYARPVDDGAMLAR